MEIQDGDLIWESKKEIQDGDPKWRYKMKSQDRDPRWNSKMKIILKCILEKRIET